MNFRQKIEEGIRAVVEESSEIDPQRQWSPLPNS